MLIIRKANNRGQTNTSWLQSNHTFSFGSYYDPSFLGFGNLLVINEDTVKPGFGFPPHAHDNMEIITYVIDGAIQHKDTMGQSLVLKPGEIQRMSAGTGIRHSEFNASAKEDLHFLQIWIIPNSQDLTPSYEQKAFEKRHNDLILLASQEGAGDGVTIHQAVNLYTAFLDRGNSLSYNFDDTNYGWLQIVKGSVLVNENVLSQGDGVAILDEPRIQIESLDASEFLLFDFKNQEKIKLYE